MGIQLIVAIITIKIIIKQFMSYYHILISLQPTVYYLAFSSISFYDILLHAFFHELLENSFKPPCPRPFHPTSFQPGGPFPFIVYSISSPSSFLTSISLQAENQSKMLQTRISLRQPWLLGIVESGDNDPDL